jgi:hypothetical protein
LASVQGSTKVSEPSIPSAGASPSGRAGFAPGRLAFLLLQHQGVQDGLLGLGHVLELTAHHPGLGAHHPGRQPGRKHPAPLLDVQADEDARLEGLGVGQDPDPKGADVLGGEGEGGALSVHHHLEVLDAHPVGPATFLGIGLDRF